MASAHVSHSTELPATPQDAWKRFADFSVYSAWNVNHVDFPDGPPTLASGAEFREQLQVRRAPAEVKWVVSTFAPDREIVLDGKGPMGIKLRQTFTFEPAGEGSRFANTLEFSAVALKPMISALEKEVGKTVAESVQRFRAQLG
ncbi:SRPBCC family protein [Conexibacter sp. CPCC 206217]|uniref:type II toxin-antitoxin system Rv0910 family toxin n=1 Tax=Conexibacter sp. CPCC 206217 TaxID=3064574 RepID=UPI00272271C4|nr:SRPBCC family protein [Conexibacter sp. CPCC 206217]MDO8208769.1 SRPBCC family protein [Conexibacter sp. CPCC 206217]